MKCSICANDILDRLELRYTVLDGVIFYYHQSCLDTANSIFTVDDDDDESEELELNIFTDDSVEEYILK